MSKIVFICDAEEGHLLPTFGLAKSLQQKGHDIYYLSILDNEPLIREQGFNFHPVLEDIYPKGFRKKLKTLALLPKLEQRTQSHIIGSKHITRILNGAYDAFLSEVKADMYFTVFSLAIDTMILYYKYNIQVCLLSTSLREANHPIGAVCKDIIEMNFTLEEKCQFIEYLERLGVQFRSITELVSPLNKLEELIICPAAFELNSYVRVPNAHYIEPSIRQKEAVLDVYALYNIPTHKKIIYASMGSQAIRHGISCDLFFGKIKHLMADAAFRDLHLILCVGPEYDKTKLEPVQDNITLLNWGPQIDILSVAALAIIHGGLGGIKECIYFGVPMIIFPQGFDQPANASRVAHHHLGFTGDIDTICEQDIKGYILRALQEDTIKQAVRNMQQVFREQEALQPGAAIVEKLIAQKENAATIELRF